MAEKEYIEREKALEECDWYASEFSECEYAIMPLKGALENLPAADVRPVVLCKDCKYYFKDEDGYEMCENSEGYDHVTEDGFCAWAKKREGS